MATVLTSPYSPIWITLTDLDGEDVWSSAETFRLVKRRAALTKWQVRVAELQRIAAVNIQSLFRLKIVSMFVAPDPQ